MPARALYIPINIGFSGLFGAHGITTRLTYTVPAGRIALVTATLGLFEPAGAAAFTSNTILNINGVNQFVLVGIGAAFAQSVAISDVALTAGDVIRIDTNNTSAIVIAYAGQFDIREY